MKIVSLRRPAIFALINGARGTLYYRHRLPIRIMHWINALCLTILLLSGLGIFNAHPALYWGKSSYDGRPPLLEIGARARTGSAISAGQELPSSDSAADDPGRQNTDAEKKGVLRIFAHEFNTTGILGISKGRGSQTYEHAFPSWLTIPSYYSLADSRLWHFFFAWLLVINGLSYVLYSLFSGHLKRDLRPDVKELRGIGASLKDHLLFRHPEGDADKRYNVLQKMTYLVVIFILLPAIILAGMAMSPMLDTVVTGWVDWFGGRQSARTIHFILAWLMVAFVLVHVFEVIVSGFWNHLRSMITGDYFIKSASKKDDAQ